MNVLGAFRSKLMDAPAFVQLTRRGVQVTSPVRIPRWQSESDGTYEIMRATVVFGPFPTDIEFDGAVLVAMEAAEDLSFPGMVGLPAGLGFSYDVELRFGRDV